MLFEFMWLFGRFAMMEGILALVRLYQRFTFSLNEGRHAGRPLEHESLITLMPKVSHPWCPNAVSLVGVDRWYDRCHTKYLKSIQLH